MGLSAAIVSERSNAVIQQVIRDADADAGVDNLTSAETSALNRCAEEDVVLSDIMELQSNNVIVSRLDRQRRDGVQCTLPRPVFVDDEGGNYQASDHKRRRLNNSDSVQERLEQDTSTPSRESFASAETCSQAPSVVSIDLRAGDRVRMASGNAENTHDILHTSQSTVPLTLSADRVRLDPSCAPDPRVSDIRHTTQEQQLSVQAASKDNIHAPRPSAPAILYNDIPFLSRARAVVEFAKLRSKNLTYEEPPSLPEHGTASPPHSSESSAPRTILPQTLPPEMYDRNTLRLPANWSGRGDTYRYMASLDIIQKRVLVRYLASQECTIDLIERETLRGVDLIIDAHTAVMYFSLPCLPSQCDALYTQVSDLSWRYSNILIVFEAFSPSLAFVPDHQSAKQISTYSQPVLKSVGRFRRGLAMNGSESIKKFDKACSVQYAFAENVNDAALYARYFGEMAQDGGTANSLLWDEREWLGRDVPAVRCFPYL
jgi:hypothetical protein